MYLVGEKQKHGGCVPRDSGAQSKYHILHTLSQKWVLTVFSALLGGRNVVGSVWHVDISLCTSFEVMRLLLSREPPDAPRICARLRYCCCSNHLFVLSRLDSLESLVSAACPPLSLPYLPPSLNLSPSNDACQQLLLANPNPAAVSRFRLGLVPAEGEPQSYNAAATAASAATAAATETGCWCCHIN